LPLFIEAFLDNGCQVMARTSSVIAGKNFDFSAIASYKLTDTGLSDFNLWKGEIDNAKLQNILSILQNQYNKEWDSRNYLIITYINNNNWKISFQNSCETNSIVYNTDNDSLLDFESDPSR